ncbi:uncharacterized protein V1518DRAFT_424801 [Limtongia smithiae]|uniref:uncharacterized protein n=1 Tax=Limtongia smithiae TaxID=1125753 RepID=UPI0034CDF74B
MSSAVTSQAPSYALAAGGNLSSMRASAPVTVASSAKDSASASSVPSAVSPSSSPVPPIAATSPFSAADSSTAVAASSAPVTKDSVADSASIHPAESAPSDATDHTAFAASSADATSTSQNNASSSASSSDSSTSTSDSAYSVEASSPAAVQKPTLTPAPPPKVNAWNIRHNVSAALIVPVVADPTPAELAAAAALKPAESNEAPVSEGEPIIEKKESFKSKGKGKEKWVPFTPVVIPPSKPNKGGKPFSNSNSNRGNAVRPNHSGARLSGENSNADESGPTKPNTGNKNFVRGNNRQKTAGAATGERKPSGTPVAAASAGDKDAKSTHSRQQADKKDDKERDDAKAASLESAEADATETSAASNVLTSTTSDKPADDTATADDVDKTSSQSSYPPSSSSSVAANSTSPASTQTSLQYQQSAKGGVPPNKGRSQRPFNHVNGVHAGSQQVMNRGPRDFQNGQAPYQQKPHSNSVGGARTSPRVNHSNAQYQQQNYNGYQQHHSNNSGSTNSNNHHNVNSNNFQYRRSSAPAPNVPPFQSVMRPFFQQQQDYASMFAYQQQFQQPPLFPGYVYEPRSMVTSQVEYYFSVDNLCKDIYLRQNMNSEGYVPLSLLAGFNRIKSLINGDLGLLAEACAQATNVEVVNQKVRALSIWPQFVLRFEDRLAAGQDDCDEVTASSTESSMAPVPIAVSESE